MAEAWSAVSGRHPLDEETISATQRALDLGIKPWTECGSLQAARDKFERVLKFNDAIPTNCTTKEMMVPGSGSQPAVPIYVNTPPNKPAVPVILIYMHGGGLVVGSATAANKSAQYMAEKCGAIVVNVEYRLLPNEEDRMAPFNDVTTAAKWVMANKEAIGGSAGSKVGVAGDSAGGQLSCCVTHDVKGIDFQVLIYPVADVDCTVPSCEEYRTTPAFNTMDMEYMFEFSIPFLPDAANDPRFNPKANPNLAASPPTLIICAELDPLLDWAVVYEEKLKQAGVKVKRSVYPGLPHGFMAAIAFYPKAYDRGVTEIAQFVKSFA